MKNYLILGANSALGVQLTRFLLLNVLEARVIGVGRNPEKLSPYALYRDIDDSRFEYHQIHLTSEPDCLLELLEVIKPEFIINFAAQSESSASWKYSWRYFETNNVALAKVIEPLVKVSWLKRWIQIGSSEVYSTTPEPATEDSPLQPVSPYSASKAAADLYLLSLAQTWNFPVNILRPSHVYGPGQQSHRIIPKTVLSALLGLKVPLEGGGETRKCFLHSADLADAICQVMEKAPIGKVYNVGPKSGHSIRNVIELVCHKIGIPFQELVELVPNRPGQSAHYLLNSSRIEQDLGWKPKIDLGQGIETVISWAQEHLDFLKNRPLTYKFQV